MRLRNIAYALIILNMPLSITIALFVLSGANHNILIAHDLIWSVLGSFLGVLVLSQLAKLERHYGKSVTVTGMIQDIQRQIIDDYNRRLRITGEAPLALKPPLNGKPNE